MKSIIKKINLVCATIVVLSLFTGCGEDQTQDYADIVSQSLIIVNSVYVKGALPSPSSSSSAPMLDTYNDGEQLLAIHGSKIIVNAELNSGSASGFYVQVDGADGYFKVTSTDVTARLSKQKRLGLLSKSKIASDYYPSFSMKLPDNIKAGEFCISYCVYSGSLVSNIIQQCVVLKELGGENSEFLTTNEWSAVKGEEYYDGEVYTNMIGEDDVTSYQESIPCGDAYILAVVNEIYRTDHIYISFVSSGTLSIEGQYYEKQIDWNSSNCTPVYMEETTDDSLSAVWSYDDATQNLIFIYNEYNEYTEELETEVEQYEASISNGNLLLKYSYSDTDYFQLTFKPK